MHTKITDQAAQWGTEYYYSQTNIKWNESDAKKNRNCHHYSKILTSLFR